MFEAAQMEALASRIEAGNCVLVLGPGSSIDSGPGGDSPIDQRFARTLGESLNLTRAERRDLNPDDLRLVSQLWQEKNKNSAYLQRQLERFYRQFAGHTTVFHRNIAALPFRLLITTTPDDFMFDALAEVGKKPVRDFYNFRKARPAGRYSVGVNSPLVYHLYGHPEDPSSLVITENDLIDFLTSVVRKDPPLPGQIAEPLSRVDSTCLFVDLGFKNWYLRVLMKSLDLFGHTDKSFALERPEFFSQSRQHQTIAYFSGTNTMDFHQEGLKEFAERLREAYTSIGSAAPPDRQPAPDAPVVFLSYASEDRDLVERLAQDLKTHGIAVWQDKQNLRAGDNWERMLMQVIQKQVDYVVAVQAPGMAARLEGVFYQEIDEALKRQTRFGDGIRFLIPIHVNEADLVPTLAHLHSISIAADGGANDLIRSIVEDWTIREARQAGVPG
jgi:hypothetical protein